MYAILLVDDEQVLLESTAMHLSKEFYVHVATNGEAAWEILNKERIDCLVTDIQMPVMDGFQLLEKISASELKIKTIAVSGSIEPWYLNKFEDLCLDCYLVKPYDIRKLRDMIKSILND